MDKPINGDKYVRTLSHYLRHNQKRLVPSDTDASTTGTGIRPGTGTGTGTGLINDRYRNSSSPVGHGVRSIISPADPMAAAYSGMVNSLWSVGNAVVNTVTPSFNQRPPPTPAQDRDSFSGAWDGTGTIPADSNPRERQLYLQAQLKAPIFPLDLYYLLYLLDRFELEGIEIDGWDGSTPRAVGDSKPRVLNTSSSNNGNGLPNSSTYSSFPPPNASTRPQSIRSFSSTALSTLTLITGWKQWSNAATSSTNNSLTIADDIHFIHKFLKTIAGLRLVAKIPPGLNAPGKGRIEGYSADGILNLLNIGQSYELPSSPSSFPRQRQQQQLLLPLAATFSSLTHLEIHKIPPRCIEGWEALMPQLKSLVVIQAGMEDVHELIVTAVVESERRRRQRYAREQNRVVLIRQEQRESLKDASTITKGRRLGQGSSGSTSPSSAESPQPGSSPSVSLTGASTGGDSTSEDEQAILRSIKMWPVLRHLSVSDNSLPSLSNSDTFSYAHAIVTLDLSHNLLISPPHGLIHLHNLHSLNLSYNMLSSVQAIYQILGNIAVLDLRGNRLESLCGLERLWNLEKVDVRENHLEEAAEVGRLAALPGIREVWSDMNPFCTTQPKYRLEILAVFKANGHDLLLDGTFASFTEKRALVTMSPTSFSTTISSINAVNVANIPAASAPSATLAKELTSPPPRITRPSDANKQGYSGTRSNNNSNTSPGVGAASDAGLDATSSPGTNPSSPAKLVKKKLVQSAKRVKRVVNLDSDHEDQGYDNDEGGHQGDGEEDGDHSYSGVLGSPAVIRKKKKSSKKTTGVAGDGGDEPVKKTKKKAGKKKSPGLVSFAPDNNGYSNGTRHHEGDKEGHVDHSECRDNHHVHRVAQLEQSLNFMQVGDHDSGIGHRHHDQTRHNQPPRGILRQSSGAFGDHHHHNHEHELDRNNGLRPSSPTGSIYSSSDDGGAEGYRRKIEAMRNEAGSNWLKVLAEMDGEAQAGRKSNSNGGGGN